MKIINVVAAIIVDNNKIFITKRGYGDFKGYYEFPGGKIEKGESKEDCIKREIFEELDTNIELIKYLTQISYDYPNFRLIMDAYIAKFKDYHLLLKEHLDARFIDIKEINNFEFLPADLLLIDKIKEYFDIK